MFRYDYLTVVRNTINRSSEISLRLKFNRDYNTFINPSDYTTGSTYSKIANNEAKDAHCHPDLANVYKARVFYDRLLIAEVCQI